ncbi:PD-(D/E)XK nuclease family protein [bacterium]|nr:PD-(D/E)XK nuclease family protein [bacterium]
MKNIYSLLDTEKTNILVVPHKIEKDIFNILKNSSFLYDVKFVPITELMNDFLGYYDDEALDIIKETFDTTYDSAKEYLDSFLISDSKYKEIVKDYYHLEQKRIEYYKDKNLLIFLAYNFNNLIAKTILNIKQNNIKFNYLEAKTLEHSELNHRYIEYPHIIREVEGLADNISKLLDEGVDPNKIFIEYTQDKYLSLIDDIFPFYNLEYQIEEYIPLSSLEDTNKLIKFFRDETNLITIDSFNKFYEKYEIDKKNKQAIDSIFKGHHRIKEDYFEYLLSKVYIKSEEYTDCISIGNFKDRLFKDDEYLFIIGANQGIFPSPYKESGLITEETYVSLGLYDENYMNNFRESYLSQLFQSIKNLTISYKLKDDEKEYIRASIIDRIIENQNGSNIEIDTYSNDRYSKKRDIIKFFKALDTYDKYGIKTSDYKNLYKVGESQKIIRNSYSNELKIEDIKNFHNFIKNKLSISHTALNNYLECPFKYFSSNILNLESFDITYDTYLGSFFHKIIEKYIDREIDMSDIDLMYEEFQNEYKDKGFELTEENTYFFKKFYEKIPEMISHIQAYYNSINKNNIFKEKRYEIKEKHGSTLVTKKGFPDLLIDDDDNVLLFDYKTGTPPSFKTENGEGLQLFLYFNLYNELHNKTKKLFGVFYVLINKNIKKGKALVSFKSKILNYDDLILKYDPLHLTGTKNKVSIEEMDKMIEDTKTYLDDTITNILNAEFDVKPKKGSCDYCNFKDICYRESSDVIQEE